MSPAMKNGRCQMHGGKSPGPPKENKNAWKHGLYSRESTGLHRQVKDLVRRTHDLIEHAGMDSTAAT
jgi:glucans biosynthesis protein